MSCRPVCLGNRHNCPKASAIIRQYHNCLLGYISRPPCFVHCEDRTIPWMPPLVMSGITQFIRLVLLHTTWVITCPADVVRKWMAQGPVACRVYAKKYAHGFVVLCFVVVMQSFIMNSHEVFIHIHQGCFAGTGAIVRLPQCQWGKPDGYGKINV